MNLLKRKRRRASLLRKSSLQLQVESLESRQLLAGDVLASAVGSTLFVTGDALANDIVLTQSAGALQVSSGSNATNISVQGDLSSVNTIMIDLHSGDDAIELRDLEINRNVIINGGSGAKIVDIDNVVLREIVIENQAAAHAVSVNGSTLSRNLGLITGAGDNSLIVTDTTVAGKVSLQREVAGSGTGQITVSQSAVKDLRVTDKFSNTTVSVTGSTLDGQIVVIDGDGSFGIDISDSTVARGATIRDAVGQLAINLDDADLNGSLWIRADGAGNHSLSMQNSSVSGNVSFNSVDGDSSVTLSGNSRVTRTLSLNEDGGPSSLMQLYDTSYIGSRLRHTIVGGGDNTSVIRDNAVVDGTVQVSNVEGHSDVRIIENAEIGRFVGSGFTTARNVEYANRDGESILADVYVPKSEGPHPAVIMVHGGGWRIGSKSAMSSRAKALANRGYVAIAINYRLAPGDEFPAQIHDVKSAIMWARENAATYDIDSDNVGVYGYSAGAHLALLAGMTDPSAGLEGPDAGAFSSAVNAIVAGGPGTEFRDVGLNDPRFSFLFGGTRAEFPDAYDNASPANWISADDPAMFLFVGENDTVIDQSNLNEFRNGVAAAGIEHEFYVAPGDSHLAAIRDATSRLYAARFLDGQLK